VILAQCSPKQKAELLFAWRAWARPKQLAPSGQWQTWLVMAGRGFGKTRTGAEWVREQIERRGRKRIALVGRTTADVRDVMVEGPSGILACCPPWFRPSYEPSKRRLMWPNGAVAITYTADKPDQLRGPQHDGAWADELAAWRFLDAWDQLMFGLRLGNDPRVVVTTTPRPIALVRELIKSPTTALTIGSTYENKSNLAGTFLAHIIKKYEGTRLGRQELNAEVLDDVPGALWKLGQIDLQRVKIAPADLVRVVVAVDPPGSTAECGIVVCGCDGKGNGFVLDDRSLAGTPAEWSAAVVDAYTTWKADCIVAEVNQGGDMVEHTIRTVRDENDKSIGAMLPIRRVWASRGKQTRAQPISALYEQGLIHHVGAFAELETQMCNWVPGETSPDRMDALVWGFTDLFVAEEEPQSGVVVYDEPVNISAF